MPTPHLVPRRIGWFYRGSAFQPFDPIAFALVPIPLFLAALVACYLPARRAARVDSNTALRHL